MVLVTDLQPVCVRHQGKTRIQICPGAHTYVRSNVRIKKVQSRRTKGTLMRGPGAAVVAIRPLLLRVGMVPRLLRIDSLRCRTCQWARKMGVRGQ